jgi:hypothetical protein
LRPELLFASARSQRGLTLISMMIVASFLAFCLYLAFRTVPAVNEYFALKRVVGVIASEGAAGVSPTQMRRSFENYAYTDDIVSVTGADLQIARAGGVTYIDVAWERKVPVAGNVSLLLEFSVAASAGQP